MKNLTKLTDVQLAEKIYNRELENILCKNEKELHLIENLIDSKFNTNYNEFSQRRELSDFPLLIRLSGDADLHRDFSSHSACYTPGLRIPTMRFGTPRCTKSKRFLMEKSVVSRIRKGETEVATEKFWFTFTSLSINLTKIKLLDIEDEKVIEHETYKTKLMKGLE